MAEIQHRLYKHEAGVVLIWDYINQSIRNEVSATYCLTITPCKQECHYVT